MKKSIHHTGITGTSDIQNLDRSRSDLQHLIYWMENDPSLHAQAEKIVSLKKLLLNIEETISEKPAASGRRPVGRYHRN